MRRIVCDTNVLISGFMYPGNERELMRRIIKGEYVNCTSRELLLEFARVIAREKFRLDEAEQERMIRVLVDSSLVTETKTQINAIKEDPADNRVLECAIDSRARYVISGDRHLLKLGGYKGIAIKTAGELLKDKINHNGTRNGRSLQKKQAHSAGGCRHPRHGLLGDAGHPRKGRHTRLGP